MVWEHPTRRPQLVCIYRRIPRGRAPERRNKDMQAWRENWLVQVSNPGIESHSGLHRLYGTLGQLSPSLFDQEDMINSNLVIVKHRNIYLQQSFLLVHLWDFVDCQYSVHVLLRKQPFRKEIDELAYALVHQFGLGFIQKMVLIYQMAVLWNALFEMLFDQVVYEFQDVQSCLVGLILFLLWGSAILLIKEFSPDMKENHHLDQDVLLYLRGELSNELC